MDLIVPLISALAVALIGGLCLDRIRAVPKRVEGEMARALRRIPEPTARERWLEELSGVLLEFEGRPLKQFREGRELVRAAEGVVDAYASAARPACTPPADSEPKEPKREERPLPVMVGMLRSLDRDAMVEVLTYLTYRERRVLELRFDLDGAGTHSHDEVGQTFNISEGRVRNIEDFALRKLLSWATAQKPGDDCDGERPV